MGKSRNMVNHLHMLLLQTNGQHVLPVTVEGRLILLPVQLWSNICFASGTSTLLKCTVHLFYRPPTMSLLSSCIIIWLTSVGGKDIPTECYPHEVWLYTCKGHVKDDWYLEAPIKICLPRNFKSDGTLPKDTRSIVEWMAIHSRAYLPIHDPEFLMYSEPLPLELAKQWDLRTLSKYLPPPITQEQINEWYPLPIERIGELEDNDSGESTSDLDK